VKLWVTGARGFIGRHVVAQAALAGHEVCAVVRPGSAPVSNQHDEPKGVRSLAIDLGDRREVTSSVTSHAPDAIIHLAWYARPQDYMTSLDNVDSLETTLSFATAALLAGCRNMVGVGTCLEYAVLPRARIEDDPSDPKSLYACCKRAAHLVLVAHHRGRPRLARQSAALHRREEAVLLLLVVTGVGERAQEADRVAGRGDVDRVLLERVLGDLVETQQHPLDDAVLGTEDVGRSHDEPS